MASADSKEAIRGVSESVVEGFGGDAIFPAMPMKRNSAKKKRNAAPKGLPAPVVEDGGDDTKPPLYLCERNGFLATYVHETARVSDASSHHQLMAALALFSVGVGGLDSSCWGSRTITPLFHPLLVGPSGSHKREVVRTAASFASQHLGVGVVHVSPRWSATRLMSEMRDVGRCLLAIPDLECFSPSQNPDMAAFLLEILTGKHPELPYCSVLAASSPGFLLDLCKDGHIGRLMAARFFVFYGKPEKSDSRPGVAVSWAVHELAQFYKDRMDVISSYRRLPYFDETASYFAAPAANYLPALLPGFDLVDSGFRNGWLARWQRNVHILSLLLTLDDVGSRGGEFDLGAISPDAVFRASRIERLATGLLGDCWEDALKGKVAAQDAIDRQDRYSGEYGLLYRQEDRPPDSRSDPAEEWYVDEYGRIKAREDEYDRDAIVKERMLR